MQMLNNVDFLVAAGPRVPNRDMSHYDGKPFKCACGKEHLFQRRMDYRNFRSTGTNAKLMVTCPQDSSFATIIETKYKFMVIFDKFISLVGSQTNASYPSTTLKATIKMTPEERETTREKRALANNRTVSEQKRADLAELLKQAKDEGLY